MSERTSPPEDVEDYGPALQQADTQRRFVTVKATDTLESILVGPLMAWRVFLHPDQRALVSPKKPPNGPVRVLGGAGTGKTVVAMHRAKYLADEVYTEPTDRVLLTAFSRSLALSIRHNLTVLNGGREHPRIEVRNVDSWAASFLGRHGVRLDILNADETRALWEDAIAEVGLDRFTDRFCRDEWERVVQPQDIRTEDAYLRAPRRGRGGPRLGKSDRVFLWRLFSSYRERMEQAGKCEYTDMIRAARQKLEAQPGPRPYRAVVVDEAQDLDTEKLKLLRALVEPGPNDLFLVGDAHQRIHAHPTTLSACGIDIRGRGKRLRVNYRTTHEIRRYALALLRGVEVDDLDGGADDLTGYTSLLSGPEPTVTWCDSEQREVAAVVDRVTKLASEARETGGICIVAATNKLLDNTYGPALQEAGVQTARICSEAEPPEGPGVRLCTMHRAKGLEFHHVVIAGLGDARFPHPVPEEYADDPIATRHHDGAQRRVLFVATTRARDSLWLSGWGWRPEWLVDGRAGGGGS